MKTLILAATALSLSSAAFADTRLTCEAPGATSGPRYVLTVRLNSVGESAARLRIPTSKYPVEMRCAIPAIEPATGPDQMYPVAFCDDGFRDGGYSVSIVGGGITGRTMATVSAKNFVKNRVVAQLLCRNLDARF